MKSAKGNTGPARLCNDIPERGCPSRSRFDLATRFEVFKGPPVSRSLLRLGQPRSGERMRRRSFMKRMAVLGAGAIGMLGAEQASAAKRKKRASADVDGIIDTNVSLSRWPFRRLPLDETRKLVARLKSAGVVQAWAGSFDALLHKNLGAANEALVQECQRHGGGLLLPFGTVNPKLPDWQEELRRCHEKHEMYGIRLFPNYHGYDLADPEFAKLLAAAESRGLIVQLALSMEDERVQHPLMRVPNVDAAPLLDLVSKFPALKVVLLNWFRAVKTDLLTQLAKTNRAWFDIAMVEGVGGIANLLREIPAERIVFGSHAPFFYVESAVLKLRESPLSGRQAKLIERGNANGLFKVQG